MLTELKLTNFRAFDDQVSLRIRPITVLIGRNSAGKSSIIKFLLMLQQSLQVSSADFLDSEGDRVHLGAFSDLKHSNSKRRNLNFEMTFETSDLPPAAEREMIEQARRSKPKVDSKTQRMEFRLVMEPMPDRNVIREERATFAISGNVSYSRKGQKGWQKAVGYLGGEEIIKAKSPIHNEITFLRFPPQASDPHATLQSYFTNRYLEGIRYDIRSMRHLSAIREESQRAIVVSSPPQHDVGQMGEYAMPHLQRLLNEDGDDAAFVVKHMRDVAGIRELSFESSMRGYLAHCRAVNDATGATAYLSDFGFGVGQCMPVFVQGAIMPKYRQLMVEQPEAQLHPTAQLGMGAFFADLWTERKVMSIVETHSANLILRLRRLVRNEEHPLKAEDVSLAYVTVEDGMTVIRNLDIGKDGSIEKGLPMEFFGADIEESMKLGAGE